jgi:hypothetical protein
MIGKIGALSGGRNLRVGAAKESVKRGGKKDEIAYFAYLRRRFWLK